MELEAGGTADQARRPGAGADVAETAAQRNDPVAGDAVQQPASPCPVVGDGVEPAVLDALDPFWTRGIVLKRSPTQD
jgi:hypothetical protein